MKKLTRKPASILDVRALALVTGGDTTPPPPPAKKKPFEVTTSWAADPAHFGH